MRFPIQPRISKYVNGYRFLSFASYRDKKEEKKLIDNVTKTGLDAAKTSSKKQ